MIGQPVYRQNTNRCRLSRRRGLRSGMSLLEVMLALAIMGLALVVVGQILDLGYRSAVSARLRTEAAIHCDTVMAEMAAGVISPGSSGNIAGTNEWVFSSQSENGAQPGLLSVTVTVSQAPGFTSRPLSLSVVRFMPDPDYDPETL